MGTEAGGFGLSLIIFTCFVKLLIFPLYEGQLRSTAKQQKVQPKIIEIQRRFGADKEKMNMEMSRFYIEEGINPLAALWPAFVQIPIFIALYRSITQLAQTDEHFKEGFLWVPSLAGPNTEG